MANELGIDNWMTCRAIEVRDWLLDRFKERGTWLASELEMAAKLSCIDLGFWKKHEVVRAIGLTQWNVIGPDNYLVTVWFLDSRATS